MMKNIKKSKYFTFISIAVFFFSLMIFLTVLISDRMINHNIYLYLNSVSSKIRAQAAILLKERNTGNLNDAVRDLTGLALADLTDEPLIRLNIYDKNKNILTSIGQNAELEEAADWKTMTYPDIFMVSTEHFSEEKCLFQVMTIRFNNEPAGYLEFFYSRDRVQNLLFNERILLFLTVFLISFFIMFFLIVMITGYIKRISFYENNALLTTVDPLTGMHTKEEFTRQLKKELDRIERTGSDATLLTCDVDNFLDINERYGFDFGDLVLKNLSRIVSENFRNFDILGRFGGDELMIFMIDAGEEEGMKAAERLRQSVQENKYYYESNEITVTVSIGIASTQEVRSLSAGQQEKNYSLFRTLIFNSLNALARSKRKGKNSVTIHTELLNS
jgi:diguanylate cyclase (GGDEF)-like protein